MFRRLQDAHNAPDNPSLRLVSGLSAAFESPRSRRSASGGGALSPPSEDDPPVAPVPLGFSGSPSGLVSPLGLSSSVEGVPVDVSVGLGVPEPVGVEPEAVPDVVGVEVAEDDDVPVGGGLLVDDPLGFSGVVTSLFAW